MLQIILLALNKLMHHRVYSEEQLLLNSLHNHQDCSEHQLRHQHLLLVDFLELLLNQLILWEVPVLLELHLCKRLQAHHFSEETREERLVHLQSLQQVHLGHQHNPLTNQVHCSEDSNHSKIQVQLQAYSAHKARDFNLERHPAHNQELQLEDFLVNQLQHLPQLEASLEPHQVHHQEEHRQVFLEPQLKHKNQLGEHLHLLEVVSLELPLQEQLNHLLYLEHLSPLNLPQQQEPLLVLHQLRLHL